MSEPCGFAYARIEARVSSERRGNGTMSRVSSSRLILSGRTCANYAALSLSLPDHSGPLGDALSFPFSRATPIGRCAVHCYSDGASPRTRIVRFCNRTLRGEELIMRACARTPVNTGRLQSHAPDVRYSGMSAALSTLST